VTDAEGYPLTGVTVRIVGTSIGAVTDLKGNYSVNGTGDALRFSYTGYETQVVMIDGRSVVDMILFEEAVSLNQLVVVGYGAQKKKEITSAVVIVDEKAIQNRPMVSAAEALQGKAAGVQVVQPSGKPGADLSVRVRGSTSVLAGNEPLYVVDGVPTTDIRGLNPSDIESMSVLKDASPAAIYGARAANGVVLITTKRGKADQSVVQFNAYGGFST
jgi:TonB-dependent SusC/RagA subfamily outer membrane receptor